MNDVYTDISQDDETIQTWWKRIFHYDSLDSKLIWHRDKNKREITITKGTGWQLQLDNELPQTMWIGSSYVIPAMAYHRVIKGKNDLHVLIREVE